MSYRRALVAAPLGLLLIVALTSAWAGGYRNGSNSRRAQVLRKLTQDPDLLINLSPSDMPSTTDMILLGRRATPAIANGLVNSMSSSVREACAAVLTATRDPRALQALMDALEDPNEWIRVLAIKALGSVENQQATPRLLALIEQDRVPGHVKRQALRSLGQLGDKRAAKPMLKYFERTYDAAAQSALWNMRRTLNPAQIRRLVLAPLRAKSGEEIPFEVLRFSVVTAGTLKLRGAVRPLTKRFESNDQLQNAIVHSLGLIGDRSVTGFLTGLLSRSASARLLNNVVFALDRLGKDPAPFLTELLADRRAYIRFNAAFVAGDLKSKSLVPQLGAALKDRNDYVRSEAAVALGKIGDPAAIPALEAASTQENPVAARDALLALATIDYAAYKGRVLKELVPSRLSSVRTKAVAFLAQQKDPTIVAPLLKVLDPGNYREAKLGLAFLGRFESLHQDASTAWLLRAAARGGSAHEALVLLARFLDPRAQFVLREWLDHPSGKHAQLLRAAGRFKVESAKPIALTWLQGTNDVQAQLYGAFVLASLADERGVKRLLAGVRDDPVYLKRTAALLLTELNATTTPGLAAGLKALLSHDDVFVRLYAARGLLESGDAAALDLLWRELNKRVPFIRDEALDIFERAPEAVQDGVFGEWLAKADPGLRKALKQIRARR